jgi:hypothetical protein
VLLEESGLRRKLFVWGLCLIHAPTACSLPGTFVESLGRLQALPGTQRGDLGLDGAVNLLELDHGRGRGRGVIVIPY